MTSATTEITLGAQAESGDALQQGVVVPEPPAAAPEAHPADPTVGTTSEVGAHSGEEAHGIFPPFDPTYFAGQILWLVLTFGFLYVLMSRATLPRIGGILEQRRVRIEGDLKEADRLRQETDRAIAAYEAALAEARQRAHGIAEETRQAIKDDIAGKRAAVEADLAQKVQAAEASIAASKAQSLANVEQIATEITQEVVGQIIGEVSPEAVREAVAVAARE